LEQQVSVRTNETAETISRFRLDNGLRLVVAPATSPGIAAVNLWYGVGSRHEAAGRTGFAHLFEHLMFEGSANVAEGEHFKVVEGLGGAINASTWTERTNYFDTVPEHGLDVVLWLEADRLATLREGVTQAVLDNQRDVVKNEKRQRYDNVPYGTASERLLAAVYPPGHPYHHPTIGSMADLDAATLSDVMAFHDQQYGPDNAVLTVVSGLDPEDVRARVEKYFGPIPKRAEVPPTPDPGLGDRMTEAVSETVTGDVPQPAVFMAYRAGALGTREHDVASLAAALLGSGEGSRMYRRLVVERQVAADDDEMASVMPFRYTPGMVMIGVLARDGVSGEQLEDEITKEVAALAAGVDADEVERARAVLERDHVRSIASPTGYANTLSMYTQLFDEPELARTWPRRLDDITPDEVAAFAADALVDTNRVVLRYVPAGEQAEHGEQEEA
jgi:predicted Zn-dependent peptidase